MDYLIETQRVKLRKLNQNDYKSVCSFLHDSEVMYAWEHAFSDEEVLNWLDENLRRYKEDGFSYYAVIEKETENLIGVSGIISETADNENYIGIGYIFAKSYWHKGFAYESAFACMQYAFNTLKVENLTAQIRPNNLTSIKLAEKLGMTPEKEFIKKYKNKEMPHILYSIKK